MKSKTFLSYVRKGERMTWIDHLNFTDSNFNSGYIHVYAIRSFMMTTACAGK